MGTFAGHIGQRHQRSGVACFCGLPPFWRAKTPGDRVRPMWWKGYRPRVRPTWEPKGTKRGDNWRLRAGPQPDSTLDQNVSIDDDTKVDPELRLRGYKESFVREYDGIRVYHHQGRYQHQTEQFHYWAFYEYRMMINGECWIGPTPPLLMCIKYTRLHARFSPR